MFKYYIDFLRCEGKYDGQNKPILMPITRKGYWLFCEIYDNMAKWDLEGILDHFIIRSDRYLSKVLDGTEFKDKQVLLFDDTFVSGTNMFHYYTVLDLWGADVTPLVYRCLLSNAKGIFQDEKNREDRFEEFLDICQIIEGKQARSYEEYRKKYENLIESFDKGLLKFEKQLHFLTEEDMSSFAIEEMFLLEEAMNPLVIDLPIIVSESIEGGRYSELSKEQWDRLCSMSESDWKFIENISEECPGVVVNGSFFDSPRKIRDIFPSEILQDCIIKCKYKEKDGKIQVVFVPFAIMKSVYYKDLVNCFVCLFEGTSYYEEINRVIEDNYPETMGNDVKQKLLSVLTKDFNLYRVLYRGIVWYFSNYVGMVFMEYIQLQVGLCDLDYDWKFMEHHIPKTLKETIRQLKKSSIYEIEAKIKSIGHCSAVDIIDTFEMQSTDKEKVAWESLYYDMKLRLLRMKETKKRRLGYVLTLEEIENTFSNKYIYAEEEKRTLITRIITLFQEGSCFSNFVINNSKKGIVERGFLPGENSTILLGTSIAVVFPYVYEFYRLKGTEEFSKKYSEFMEMLRAYFHKQEYFKGRITSKGYQYCVSYFKGQGENEKERLKSIESRICSNLYIVQCDLESASTRYADINCLITSWGL